MNGASSFWRQEGSILARLRRAIDRYEAVGWHHRAKATNELLRRVSLQQTLASWHEIEKLLMEDQIPLGNYGDAVPHHRQVVSPPPEPPADHYIGCNDLCVVSCSLIHVDIAREYATLKYLLPLCQDLLESIGEVSSAPSATQTSCSRYRIISCAFGPRVSFGKKSVC